MASFKWQRLTSRKRARGTGAVVQLGTGALESTELIKAPQPDQDANAVAGDVNLVSRRAFDTPGRRVAVTAGTIWKERGFDDSPYQDRADDLDLFALAYSDVFGLFGAKNNRGLAFNYNHRVQVITQDEQCPGGNVYARLSQAFLNANTANPVQRAWGTGESAYPAKAQNVRLSLDYELRPDDYLAPWWRPAIAGRQSRTSAHRPSLPTAAASGPDGTVQEETVFVITSRAADGLGERALGAALRAHWAIEDGLHYRRDRTYDEDRCQFQEKATAHVMASLSQPRDRRSSLPRTTLRETA